jgi:hypothetical protein
MRLLPAPAAIGSGFTEPLRPARGPPPHRTLLAMLRRGILRLNADSLGLPSRSSPKQTRLVYRAGARRGRLGWFTEPELAEGRLAWFTEPELAEGERRMVDLTGIEPVTSSMPLMRAPNCATGPHGKRPS